MAKKKIRSTTPRTAAASSVQAEAPVSAKTLSSEYHYVIRDLVQIAIIAAVLVVGLIALSFFI